MRRAIGGYLELEMRKREHYHKKAIRLNTGRNCLEYILRARGYKHVWLPYYTCDVLLEPLNKLDVSYSFYSINKNLEPERLPNLHSNEAFVYTNYYGIKQAMAEALSRQYGSQLIVDNAQAFFAKPLQGIDTFYTARKFFGVPDGAYLCTDVQIEEEFPQDVSMARIGHLLKRVEYDAESGYADYQQHEEDLCNQPIKWMSHLTERLLESADYGSVASRRRENFMSLHAELKGTNGLSLEIGDAVPMSYPYWSKDGAALRERLRQQRIYVPKYWPNKVIGLPEIELSLMNNLLPLPIDQRYGKEEMGILIDVLKQNI